MLSLYFSVFTMLLELHMELLPAEKLSFTRKQAVSKEKESRAQRELQSRGKAAWAAAAQWWLMPWKNPGHQPGPTALSLNFLCLYYLCSLQRSHPLISHREVCSQLFSALSSHGASWPFLSNSVGFSRSNSDHFSDLKLNIALPL